MTISTVPYSTALLPFFCSHRRRRCPAICVGPTRQDSCNSSDEKQQLNLSVLRFTLGIPGLDESYLPRYIGLAFGSLIVANHFFSTATPSAAQLRSEAVGICLAAFSTTLPYLGRFLKGSNSITQMPLPEGNKQVFYLSENLSDTQKEDLAWASYVLLRNTNTMSVMIMVQDGACVRGYWGIPEDIAQADLVDWFNRKMHNLGFLGLQDTLYFPQISDSQLQDFLPRGTLSLLLYPISCTSYRSRSQIVNTTGQVLLASSSSDAYSDKDRAWIGAVANKFKENVNNTEAN